LLSIEQPTPSAGEVENRHIEDEQRIVPSPAPLEYFEPAARGILLRSFHF
jgi:hypothetical protein